MIERQNILELLGRNAQKYHSCLLTSYSFDFLYFEQRILPLLRSAGILNINMFLDASMLDQHLASSPGRHLHAKKSYSITPVVMNGAFHPKILLAVGKKKGFLAVGSGNFTTSGMSSNDEIWSAFSLSDLEDPTLPIFKHAADFFRQLETLTLATNKEKIGWIAENSQWYAELLNMAAPEPALMMDNERFHILSTRSNASFYQNLLETLPPNPNLIKILSPFYNENGAVIKSLVRDLNPAAVYSIVDPKFGTLPNKIDSPFPVQFSDWNLLAKEDRYKNARLHAKAIQFEYPDKTYFLFGSPNATEEALGTQSANSRNAEMAVLIQSNGQKDYFLELGIKFPEEGNFNMSQYKRPESDQSSPVMDSKRSIRIVHAEFEPNTLVVYTDIESDKINAEIQVFDADGVCLFSSSSIAINKRITFQIPPGHDETLFKTALFRDGERISNFALVHQVGLLNRTNPDNRLTRFNELLNSEQFSDQDFYELLEYAHFKDKRESHSSKGMKEAIPIGQTHESEEDPETISEEEFNRKAAEIETRDSALRKQLALIEEFLHSLTFWPTNEKEDVSENSETAAKEAGDQGMDADVTVTGKQRIELSFEQGQRFKHLLHRKLNQITETLQWHKKEILNSIFRKEEYKHPASLDEIQALLVGCHLILLKINKSYTERRSLVRLEFNDKKALHQLEKDLPLVRCDSQKGNRMNQVSFTIDEKASESLRFEIEKRTGLKLIYMDGTPSQVKNHPFFDLKGWPDRNCYSAVEKLFTEGLGAFLLMMMNGEESYTGKDLDRWETYKKRLMYRVLLILNMFHWGEDHKKVREILLLNTFYSLSPEGLDEHELFNGLISLAERLDAKSILVDESVDFTMRTFTNFRRWHEIYQTDVNKLKEDLDHWKIGRIIFYKKLGFSQLDYFSSDRTVNLSTPLGIADKSTGLIGFKRVLIGLTPAFFNQVTK